MIIYNPRRCAGYIVLTSCKGSSFFKAMPLPIVATVFTMLIKLLPHIFNVPNTRAGDDAETDTSTPLIDHPQASYALTSIVGFLLLFRSNLAYGRFWEGRTAVQQMGAAWAEAGSLVVSFDTASKGRDDYAEWKADFVHLLSLMHALAVMALRTDADLTNLVPHSPYQDFDGVTSVSGNPTQSGDEGGAFPISRTSTKLVDVNSRFSPSGGVGGHGGSAGSIISRVSSLESDASGIQLTPRMSPHARLRQRSSTQVLDRPPRPLPKTRQTGVVSRSGLSSRSHYFPIGAQKQLKHPLNSSPRLVVSTDQAESVFQLERSKSASIENESTSNRRDTGGSEAELMAENRLGATTRDSHTLIVRRSKTMGDLSAIRDAHEDGRPELDGASCSTTGLPLELKLEQEQPTDEGQRPRVHTDPAMSLASTQIDTNGDGEADATAFDTTGDGRFDSFDTNGDGKIDKVIVDVSRTRKSAATKRENGSDDGTESAKTKVGALPRDPAHRNRSSRPLIGDESFAHASMRNTYMEKHHLDERLAKYTNAESTGSSNSYQDELEQPRFPLMVIGGLWDSERERLEVVDPLHAERVYVVQSWVHHALVERYELRGLGVPAPLLAQIYAQISAGFSAFMQCKKLVDTPFPFPYAQIVLICLIILSAFLPIQVCIIVNSTPLAMALTFVTVWAFCSINEVAMELEEPFMDERNDIALADLHVDFSEKILTLLNRLTWRSSWPERDQTSTLSADGNMSPRHRISKFAAEQQASAREPDAATSTAAAAGAGIAAGTLSKPHSQASVDDSEIRQLVRP